MELGGGFEDAVRRLVAAIDDDPGTPASAGAGRRRSWAAGSWPGAVRMVAAALLAHALLWWAWAGFVLDLELPQGFAGTTRWEVATFAAARTDFAAILRSWHWAI